MKKISSIHRYVIDNLIKDKKLSIDNLIDAIVRVCSYEQLNNILAVIISSNEESEKLKNTMVQVSIISNEDLSNAFKVGAMNILKKCFSLTTKEAQDYLDISRDYFVNISQPITYGQAENLKTQLKKYNIDVVIRNV